MIEDEGAVRHPSMSPPLPEAEDDASAAPAPPEESEFSLPDAPSHDAGAPLPAPIAPVDPVVRRGARLVAAGTVVLVLVSVGVGVGWLLRSGTGSDLDHSATGLTVVVGEAPVTDPGDEPVHRGAAGDP